MKMTGKKQILIYFLFILFYIGITLLILQVLGGESVRSRLLLEYDTERTASLFMETLMRNVMSEEIELPEQVIGFGIYQSNGGKIRAWGEVPGRIDPADIGKRDRFFIINKHKQSLTLIRRIGYRHMRSPGPPHFMNHMDLMRQHQGRNAPTFLYFELDASQYLHRTQQRHLIGFFLSLFLLAVMTGLLFLYRKNQEYRRKLESREQLARLGEMARVLAHEIKNPLGAMRIQTGYLKKILPQKHTHDLYIIEEEINRLSLLTNRISDFVRNPIGSPEKLALVSFIEDLLKRFSTPVAFTSMAADDSIFFDKERLRSVLENVINNALESHQAGKNKDNKPVNLELKEDKKYIILSIYDRGTGILPDQKDKVFDPFYTTRAKGSGIGLSITKRFLEANRGKITLVSRDGGGTEVRLYFRRVNEKS